MATLVVRTLGTGSGTVHGPDIRCVLASGKQRGKCEASYPTGTSVTLTALKERGGHVFVGWGGACAPSGPKLTCTLDMVTDRTVTATYAWHPPKH